MGTAKRERQKANRQIRLQELAKEQRKEKSKRVALRVILGVVGFIAVVGGVYLISGGSDDNPSSGAITTTTAAGVTTTTVDPNAPTTTAPPKPTVSVPGTDPTELKVTTLRDGTGDAAKNGDTLDVHYVGVLSKDGTEFDNSYDRGAPLTLTLGAGQVIQGWEQGLVGVKVGGQYQIDIPAELAYGANGAGESIPPNSGLTFVVDIMSITPGTPTSTTVAGATTTVAGATTTTSG